MAGLEHQHQLQDVVAHLEAAAAKLEHVIEHLASDDSGSVDLAALQRARESATRAANITLGASSPMRRAFD